MTYSVVIVTYNRIKLLEECVSCVLSQTLPVKNIIIVNNASTDGTDQYLSSLSADPRFIILTQQTNLGGAGGFYKALEAAGDCDCDNVLIIDDDAMIAPDFISSCDSWLSANPESPACSGTVMTDGEIQLNHRRVIGNKLIFSERNIPLEEYSKPSFHYELATFCGLVIRREVIKKIGLPKAEYFIWYDDTEYSMRLRELGGIQNINSAVLNHKTKITTAHTGFFERMNWKTYYGHRNRYDAVRCHLGSASEFAVFHEFFVFMLGALIMQLSPQKRERGRYIYSMLRDAQRDGRASRLGKNDKYLPGTN